MTNPIINILITGIILYIIIGIAVYVVLTITEKEAFEYFMTYARGKDSESKEFTEVYDYIIEKYGTLKVLAFIILLRVTMKVAVALYKINNQ